MAELPEGLVNLRFHDLRHTAVSRMVDNRVPLPTIAKIVGWSRSTTVSMAMRYSHPDDEALRRAVETTSTPTVPNNPTQQVPSKPVLVQYV